MSSLLSAELAATCNALGYFDPATDKYYADSNTLETVKDLIRYLRRDDASHDIRRHLGETKVLQTDLLPLLKSYWEETDLFDVLLRLIVNLTTPALILWNEEIPADKTVRNHYLQIEEHLQSYKEAFADEGVWAVLSTRLSKIMEVDYNERGDDNSLIIERILILIRNVLYVPADSMEKRPDNDASIHDQVLWALHQSGMLDIILYITSSASEQAYYMHILEILSFMLREQKASDLASAALQRSQTEKIRDEAELLAIRHRETSQKQKKTKMYSGTRHSRFGGTFVVKSMKSISDNELIYHKPLNKLDALNFDADKQKPKTPKNRLPIVASSMERRSAFTIRLFLKEFCVEFLNGAYNTLMYHVKDNLVRAKAQTHDESYYLWALRFFMEFNRCYKFEVKLVSETMSVQIFHYVQQQSENFFDLMQTDKKKLKLWSRRLHLALLAYRELFLTLCAMDRAGDGTVRDSAKVIKSNIFYVPEYREFVLTLLINYHELKMSDVYLKDLIETQHIFLKMFESFCAQGNVVVQRKSKGRRPVNKSAKPKQSQPVELDIDTMWDEAAAQLSAVLEGGGDFLTEVVPFDAASEIPIDDQKADAMKNIQRKLRSAEYEQAIALLRAAREVWPENDSFGSNNMAPEEEFLALRDIFLADLGENLKPAPATQSDQIDEYEDDEEEEEDETPQYDETDFSFDEFVKRLPHPKIVRACGLALKDFETNSVNTNHCIVKLLHRIAFDCKMYVMVFQLSVFRTFQRIYAVKELPQYKELVKFATYIMRQFFKVAENNKKVFVEALFWKSKKEAYEIEAGYGETEKSSAAAKVWSEQEEDELRRLFIEHQQQNIEEDVVDWICENLIDNTKSRRAVLKKLKELYLLNTAYKSGGNRGGGGIRAKIPKSWGAAEEDQLRELYEEFKDAMDPLGCIMARLEINRPKNRVIEKMLIMGLIQDKKELRKKRATTSGKGRSGGRGRSSRADSDEDSTDSDDSTADRAKPSKKKSAAASIPKINLAKHIVANIEAGRRDAVEWLREFLSDAVEDFGAEDDDDDVEGLPLVPVMDYAVAAMEIDEFKQMLKAFGICEPSEEGQEAYWRLPGNLSVDAMKAYCELLKQGLENNLSIDDLQGENGEAVQNGGGDSSGDDYIEKLKKRRNKKKADPSQTKNKKIRKQKGKRRGSSSDCDTSASHSRQPNKRSAPEINTGKVTSVPRAQLVKLVLRCVESGQQQALEWFKECLSDAIEDFGDEDFDGIPLVPIMDYAEAAMVNEEFKRMLKDFGICEPFDEQEMYWRIPSTLTVDIMKNHIDLLEQALSNKLTADTLETESNQRTNEAVTAVDNDESSDEDYLEKLKKMRSKKNPESSILHESKEPAAKDIDISLPSTSNVTNLEDNNAEEEEVTNRSFHKSARKIIDSESDSDGNNEADSNEVKRYRSESDSDKDKPVKKKSRVIESDED